MKILDFMSFNVDWFLEPQGLLITGGVLLLLIALIILLTSGKKDDDEDVTAAVTAGVTTGIANDLAADVGSIPVSPVQTIPTQPVMAEVPTLDPIAPISQPEIPQTVNGGMGIADVAPVSPVINESPILGVEPTPVVEQQPVVSPVLEINSTLVQPQVETLTPSFEPAPVVPSISEFNIPDPIAVAAASTAPVIEPVVSPIVEQPAEPIQVTPQQTPVSIYGGVNPTQDIFKPAENAKPVIYGGADPLENTGALPKVEIAPAVEQPVSEVNLFEPAIEQPQPFAPASVVNSEPTPVVPMMSQSVQTLSSSNEPEELVF